MSSISSVSELEALAGLDAAKRTLRGVFKENSPVHAVLFYGEEGAGKSTLANLLAQYWLCLHPTVSGACLECKACMVWSKGSAADLLSMRPWGASNILKLAAIHRVEPVQEDDPPVPIQEFLRTMPIQARSKVVILESAERMNGEAARALLKTLEEPPDYARFILTTTEVGRVEATLRSRCMAVPCELPPENVAAEAWESGLAGRSPGLLARIRANREIYEAIFELAKTSSESDRGAVLALSEKLKKIVERLQKAEETNARSAGATALRAFGAALRSLGAPAWHIQRIATSHRRILGNVNSALEFDALFSELLADNG